MCTGTPHGLLDRRDPASVHSTEHCLVGPFSSHAHGKKKKPSSNNGARHSRGPKRGALQRRCRSGRGPPSPPCCELSLLRSSSAGDASGCVPPSHPAGRLGWAGLGVVCLRGRRAVTEVAPPTTHNQSASARWTSMKSRKQAQQQQANISKLRRHLGVAISPPLQPLALHLHVSLCSSRVRRRAGETPPHTPPHRRQTNKPAVMVRSAAREISRERSGVRGVEEEEPRSPLAVAIGRIILDVGSRRSKSLSQRASFPLGAARQRRATVWVRVWIAGLSCRLRWRGRARATGCSVCHIEKRQYRLEDLTVRGGQGPDSPATTSLAGTALGGFGWLQLGSCGRRMPLVLAMAA